MRISDWSSDVCSSDLGRENLVLIAKLRHVDRPGTVADDLLDRFSLTDAGRRRVGTYSGGMRRRLDIAMSLIGSQPVVFLDEPTTGLDPHARLDAWQSMRSLAVGGTTVVLTQSSPEEAEQMAERIRSEERRDGKGCVRT